MSSRNSASRLVTTCLSEDEVLAFAAGRLSPERRKAAHLHFDDCDICQELLNEAVRALGTAPTDQSGNDGVAWSTQFRPGTLVGQRYVICQFVARGGMGEVYEALDRELQERVALKTVTATACDSPHAVRRLKAEVQLARRVSHPNVCRIYDFGTHVPHGAAPPTCFLTMEFVEGETLGQRVRKNGALPVEQACLIARKLLLGLRAAHDAGVLHRDFKSDNVMLRRDDEKLSPLILDFGLARALDRQPDQHSSSHHGVVGTFAYIAPEQLEGEPHSTASDIYSFGVVWYEMLTGELPFKSQSAPRVSAFVRRGRAVAPPSSKNPRINGALDALVLGCLHRSPGERFQSVDEVLSRLDALERRSRTPRARIWLAPLLLAASVVCAALYLSRGVLQDTSSRPATAASATPATPATKMVVPFAATAARSHPQELARETPVPPTASAARATRSPTASKPSSPSGAANPAPSFPAPATGESAAPSSAPAPRKSSTSRGWENPFERPPR